MVSFNSIPIRQPVSAYENPPGPVQFPPDGTISAELGQLGKSVDSISTAVADLCIKLSPVVVDLAPTEGVKNQTSPEPQRCEVAREIVGQRDRLVHIEHSLRELMERLRL